MIVIAIAGLAAAILLSSAGPLATAASSSACGQDAAVVETAEVTYFAEHGAYGRMDQLVPRYLSHPSTLHAVALTAGDYAIRPIGSCRR